MKSPGGDLATWTVLWAAAGAFLCCLAFRDGKPGVAIVYGILTVASACLWFDIRQAKWVLIAYFAVGSLVLLVTRGLELRAAVLLCVGFYSIYLLVRWNGRPREDCLSPAAQRLLAHFLTPEGQAELEQRETETEKIRRWQVMIELPSERAITGPEIAEKASTAFGHRFSAQNKPLDPVDVVFLASDENGVGPHFYCGFPPYLFEVIQIFRFLFFQYMPSATYSEELENGYRWTAKFAAEFVSISPASVNLGDRSYGADDPAAIAEAMRSANPEVAMEPFLVKGDEPASSE